MWWENAGVSIFIPNMASLALQTYATNASSIRQRETRDIFLLFTFTAISRNGKKERSLPGFIAIREWFSEAVRCTTATAVRPPTTPTALLTAMSPPRATQKRFPDFFTPDVQHTYSIARLTQTDTNIDKGGLTFTTIARAILPSFSPHFALQKGRAKSEWEDPKLLHTINFPPPFGGVTTGKMLANLSPTQSNILWIWKKYFFKNNHSSTL